MSTESNLALEYFKIGNCVAAFYVIQTFLFLNSIYKEPKLLAVLYNNKKLASSITWMIASIYIVIVLGCAGLEFWLHSSATDYSMNVATSALLAGLGRSFLIAVLAWACSQFIKNHIKIE
jgi:hypothetical protein